MDTLVFTHRPYSAKQCATSKLLNPNQYHNLNPNPNPYSTNQQLVRVLKASVYFGYHAGPMVLYHVLKQKILGGYKGYQ